MEGGEAERQRERKQARATSMNRSTRVWLWRRCPLTTGLERSTRERRFSTPPPLARPRRARPDTSPERLLRNARLDLRRRGRSKVRDAGAVARRARARRGSVAAGGSESRAGLMSKSSSAAPVHWEWLVGG